jgi:hydrogenase expression/formation protein HypE
MFLSLGLIIEEGFLSDEMEKILNSAARAAEKAGVKVVTGDTKVVPKGAADKLFINTSGIGMIPPEVSVGSGNVMPGDKIILSGSIGDHGLTILTQRENMSFKSNLKSDTAPLNLLVARMLKISSEIHALRDPTRGGVGTALNEIAESSRVGLHVYEERIPIKKEVKSICEFLGLDPLYIANEGKFISFVSASSAEQILEALKGDPLGKDSAIIGEVVADCPGTVVMETSIGGTRIIDMQTGKQLPRIC